MKKQIKSKETADAKFRTVFNTGSSAFALIDYDSTIYMVNDAFCKLSGYRNEEVTGLSWTKLIPSEDHERFKENIKQIIEDPSKIQDSYEISFFRKDGEKRYVLVSISLLGHEKKIFISFIDITDRKLAENQIKSALREKELLIKEIHHRVKNNMQVVVSLVKLLSNSIPDPEIKEYFTKITERINSMALIHQRLYKSSSLSEIDFGDYIKDLVIHLYNVYCLNNRIDLIMNIDSVKMGIDNAIPCGLLINEIVSNAFKHAFPGNRSGTIQIDFTLNENEYFLKITDDGVGIIPDVKLKYTGLGTELIYMFAGQLDADIAINSINGTEYVIRFRAPEYPNRI